MFDALRPRSNKAEVKFNRQTKSGELTERWFYCWIVWMHQSEPLPLMQTQPDLRTQTAPSAARADGSYPR